jgi:hypothetical protein
MPIAGLFFGPYEMILAFVFEMMLAAIGLIFLLAREI